jgi:hypothetical protein
VSRPGNTLPPLLLNALVLDGSAAPLGDLDVAAAVAAHRALAASPHGELLGALLVPSSGIDALRDATLPDDDLRIALVADEGLLGLTEARHAVQDDPWTELTSVQIALPAGFDPAAATRALLDELSFTVPTYVELPRTGFDTALDVLADDGVERATFRCCATGAGSVPTDGELAAFVHGAVNRSVPFTLIAGQGRCLHSGGEGGGDPHHGVLNVLAAVAACLDGASTTDLAELLSTARVDTLLETIDLVPPLKLRDAFHGYACGDVATVIDELAELAGPDALSD